MEQKYLTFLYNVYNIIHVIRTGHILYLPEIKQPKLRIYNNIIK